MFGLLVCCPVGDAAADAVEVAGDPVLIGAVIAELTGAPDLEQFGFRQDLQVMGDGGLGDPEAGHEFLAGNLSRLRDEFEHLEAAPVGERFRNAVKIPINHFESGS